ncbi:MAG TPA: Spy/CpxP family protein refolding chaperone [Burkholderiaceae bacterium]|nr:Spy/CpxP family protein refolding chaperone [Burkholderiaceae bacterium]
MSALQIRARRAIAAAGIAAALLVTISPVFSAAADKAAASPQPASSDAAQRVEKHLQAHLDELAARLEIRASQEPAWQAFAAAYREVLAAHLAQWQAATAGAAELDAAALARKRADWAAENAQKLARLAEATAKLQQTLGPDQRLVLNEVARRFAQEHFAHGPMHGHHDGPRGADGDGHDPSRAGAQHCPGGRGMGDGAPPYGPEDGGGPHAGAAR